MPSKRFTESSLRLQKLPGTQETTKPALNDLFIIGITGTNGKTTVAHLIGETLNAAGINCFVLGTLNSEDRNLSTPQLADTTAIMEKHLAEGGTHFVMEVTSEGIDQGRVAGIDFDIKILTNITQDHLDYHSTFNNYKSTKLGFMLRGDSHRIYPDDFKNETIDFTSKLLGKFNRSNIKAAASALRHMGLKEESIETTLSTCPAPRGRLEEVCCGQEFIVVVDYAHTPDGLSNVLVTLKRIAHQRKGKLLVLFGCGGNRDKTKRPIMGKIASQIADTLIITEDNPRQEDSDTILEEIRTGIRPEFNDYTVLKDRAQAIALILQKAHPADVVVLAGKGHEDYQILKSGEIAFDDKVVATQILLASPTSLLNIEALSPNNPEYDLHPAEPRISA